MTDQVSLAMGNARLYETVKSELAKQKQAEKALRENEKRMQTFLDSTSDMAFLKDRNFRHTIANRALCRFYGRTESEIIGKTDFDLMTESAAAKCRETDEQTLRSNAKIINEEVIGDRHYETMKFPVEFEDGEKGIGAYIRDITERKQTEDTLRTSEERFRKIFDEGQIGIVILNSKFGFEKANPIFCRITGYSPDELMLMTFMDITHKDHIAEDVENVAKLTRGEISCYKTEKRYLRKDDNIVWGKVSVTVVRDKDNNFLYYLVIVDDITERKCAEEKITSLLSEKDFILKEVHHRIKNNMSTIQGLLNLQAGTLKGHSASAALLDAGSRVNSMMVLYDKLYQSSSFNDISIKSYLSSLVDEIVANFPASITVTIEKKIDDIVLDVTKLQPLGIIINELITNIMKYAFTGRDGGLIAIEAVLKPGSKEKENIVSMVVSDNGNGMPESTDFENSTGFGLMLVGMLTRQLKGTVYTERADGTRIILEFPAL
jgi:PAS domain S-box-containing protein